ncbi:MAG: hypothetical protein GY822_32640 [Deltaproteobacteria bacterium]|nr:hypothetical protein [Deltaproteobacteria bacterium]
MPHSLIQLSGRSNLNSVGPRSRRRVGLLSVDWHRPNDPRVPLGHASIHANLLHSGIEVSPLVWHLGVDECNIDY